jgi:hypothetical protein
MSQLIATSSQHVLNVRLRFPNRVLLLFGDKVPLQHVGSVIVEWVRHRSLSIPIDDL